MYNTNNELIKCAKQKDRAALEKLVENNMGLIKKIASKFLNRGIEFEDAVQIGSLGLMKAVEKFDFSYNVMFSTYAVPMILGEIKRFLRDDGMIKVSRSIKENHYKITIFSEEYQRENNKEPTISEISEKTGILYDDVVVALSYNPVCESLSAPLNDEKTTLEEKIPDIGNDEEKIINDILVKDILNTLPKREKLIIEERYFNDATQSDIAKMLNISQVQVSRLEKKILSRLKDEFMYSQ